MPQTLALAADAAATPRRFFPGQRVTRAAIQSKGDPYEFVMSTDDVDRVGDIVEITGIDLGPFLNNPIALWNHDADSPIGTWTAVRREGNKLVGKLQMAGAGTSQLIDRLIALIEQRILRAVSIGFKALEAIAVDPKDPWSGLIYTKTELLECSLVSIPANSEALRVRGLRPSPADAEIFTTARAEPSPDAAGATTARKQRAAPSGKAPPHAKLGVGKMPRTLAEKIVAHQQRSAAIDDEINAITIAAANDDDRDLTEDETDKVSALSAEKMAVIKSIETLGDMETALAAKARAPSGHVPSAPARVAVKEVAGGILSKMATVAALSFMTNRSPDAIIAERYREDDRIKDLWDYTVRSATQPADTTTPGWAKELIRQDVGAFLEELTNVSVFAGLRARPGAVSFTFDGAGSITLPGRQRGSLAGAWVGEGGVIPVLQGVIQAVTLTPTKLAGITTFTRELQSSTTGQIEQILRDGLRTDTADILDKALLSDDPARAMVRPAGLLNGVTPVASSGGTPEDIRADILAAITPIIQAGGGRSIVLIMNPLDAARIASQTTLNGNAAFPEVEQGRLTNFALLTSLNVELGWMIAVDVADFASSAGVPEYRVSEEATLTMANADGTPPTQAVTAAGVVDVPGEVGPDRGIAIGGGASGAGTAGVVAMSVFQQYLVALRMVLPVSWAMRRAGMVGAVNGIGS